MNDLGRGKGVTKRFLTNFKDLCQLQFDTTKVVFEVYTKPTLSKLTFEYFNTPEKCKKWFYLFEKENGGVLTAEAIRYMTKSICKELGFKIAPHQLRHCYCTMLYYSGITIKQTQNLMGHSSAKMVYDLYAHLNEQNEKVADTVNTYIEKITNK